MESKNEIKKTHHGQDERENVKNDLLGMYKFVNHETYIKLKKEMTQYANNKKKNLDLDWKEEKYYLGREILDFFDLCDAFEMNIDLSLPYLSGDDKTQAKRNLKRQNRKVELVREKAIELGFVSKGLLNKYREK